MSNFRAHLQKDQRKEGFDVIRESALKAVSPPGLHEEQEDAGEFANLKAKRDAARRKLKENKGSMQARQEWLFYEALYRDIRYSARGRGWCRQVGWDGLLEEVYGGCKLSVDAALEE
jgi:hypothetical protein